MRVYIDNDEALEMLIERVSYWTEDVEVLELYEKFYKDRIENGFYAESEWDVMTIVDNDYVNWTSVYTKKEIEEEDIDESYIECTLGDLCIVVW